MGEGEWLEVRYDKSMSKQVQRYSADIRPHPDDLKPKRKKKQKTVENPPFADEEMKIRAAWDKQDEVEIFSNTHQEWYLGEVVDIIKDEEGEWLNCVWARANGEAMSKQVQRCSTDVRPVQYDNSSSDGSSDEVTSNSPADKNKSHADKIKDLARKIAQRKNNFRRRCPAFSRTLRPSTFTYPATSASRRSRKLLDLEETQEKNQHVIDCMPSLNNKKNGTKKIDIESMKPLQVRDFIRSLGSAYERYSNKFRTVKGSQLLKFSENSLQKLGISAKLHRNKILLEIARNDKNSNLDEIFCNDVEILNWNTVQVQEWCSKTQVISIYAHKFFAHGIDGMLLFELDAKDLQTIGVKKIHQQRVLDIISKFAKQSFLSYNEEEKDPETENKMNGNVDSKEIKGTRGRGSVAHVDVSQLGISTQLNGGGGSNQNNDAIIYTMGQLLLELGQMFKVGKVQDLTNRLKQQLNELQANSNHPQMIGRGSLDLKNRKNSVEEDEDMDADKENTDEIENGRQHGFIANGSESRVD